MPTFFSILFPVSCPREVNIPQKGQGRENRRFYHSFKAFVGSPTAATTLIFPMEIGFFVQEDVF
jgi:hypothetical protein